MINLSDLQEFELPGKTLTKGFVYLLFFRREVVYVGQTLNIYSRMIDHRKRKVFDKCMYYRCQIADLNTEEKRCISQFRPIYNYQRCGKEQMYKVIDGHLFSKQYGICAKMNNGALEISGHHSGYYNDNYACIMHHYRHMVKYNIKTNELTEWNGFIDKKRRFDFDAFEFVDEEKNKCN